MNEKLVKVFGFMVLANGIVFLASSIVGLIFMVVNLLRLLTSIDGNFYYLFYCFGGLFWGITHFLVGKSLFKTGKDFVSKSEEYAGNPWLRPSYHAASFHNLGLRRTIGYFVYTSGILLIVCFGVSCLFTLVLFLSLLGYYLGYVENLPLAGALFFGPIQMVLYYFLGCRCLRYGIRRAFIVQHGTRRSLSFYYRYLPTLNLSRVFGFLLQMFGGIFVILSSASMVFAVIAFRGGGKFVVLLEDQMGFLGYFIGGWLWGFLYIFIARYFVRTGKRFSMLTGEELLSIDNRPPVLYLRSFSTDDELDKLAPLTREGKGTYFGTAWGWIFPSIRNQEEILASVLKRIGPPITVGMPNEEVPKIGIARIHFNEDEWREKVADLISRASLVLMVAGFTKSYWWELETVVKTLDPKRLMILLPFDSKSGTDTLGISESSDGYELFKKRADSILPKPLPNFSPVVIPGSGLSGVLWFDSEWNPKMYDLNNTRKSLKKTLVHVFNYY